MTDIMKLADDYAEHRHTQGAPVYNAVSACARAALQSAIEALQAENERLTVERDTNKRMRDLHFTEKNALQSQLDAMGKGEPRFWYDEDMGELYSFSDNRPVDGLTPLYAAPKALAPLTDGDKLRMFDCLDYTSTWGRLEFYMQGIEDAERRRGIGGTP